MKQFRQVLTITSDTPVQFFNLSYEVEACLRKCDISDGICTVISQHSTSAVFLENDNEALQLDWQVLLKNLVSDDTCYKVDYSSAGAAHLKQMLLGGSVTVPVTDGRLDLGPRQYIMYGDFDGCREKNVIVKIIGE